MWIAPLFASGPPYTLRLSAGAPSSSYEHSIRVQLMPERLLADVNDVYGRPIEAG